MDKAFKAAINTEYVFIRKFICLAYSVLHFFACLVLYWHVGTVCPSRNVFCVLSVKVGEVNWKFLIFVSSQTSVPHIDINLAVHSPSQTSLLNVRVTAPSSGRKSPDSSDDESVTNPQCVRSYKSWVGANLSSSNPATGSESDRPADAPTGGGSLIKEEEAAVEVDSQNINLLTLTSGAHREGEEEVEEQEKEKEEEESPLALQDVNLFTLKFGTHRREEVEQEEKSEDESPSAPNLPEGTARGEGAESQTVSCSEDEEEEEEELTYIGRFCAHHRH